MTFSPIISHFFVYVSELTGSRGYDTMMETGKLFLVSGFPLTKGKHPKEE